MFAPLIAFTLIAFAPGQKLALEVNAKQGESISGEKSFAVKVQSKNPVTQVEFYVGGELRDTDSSTPYEFKLDTLNESDGDLKVKFAAYTTEGENAAKTLTLKIDNGISMGVAYHVQHAKDALSVSKWDDAIASGRVALKADPKSADARLILARAYMGKGMLDKAQKFAEDAANADPKSGAALEMVAAVNLNRAFSTISRSDKPSETMVIVGDAIKAAVTARRKSLDQQLDNFGLVTDANRLAWADLAMRAGKYSGVIDELTPLFRKDTKNNDVADRLVYAQLRLGRFSAARETLDQIRKYGALSAYGNALDAVFQSENGDDKKADAAIREAILSDPDSLGVKSAQAYIALKRNKNSVLSQLAIDLAKTESQRTEVNYFIAALQNRMADPSARRYFQRAVLIEPTNYDMYIEWGNQALGLAISGRLEKKDTDAELDFARAMYDAALIANPSSAQALTGVTLVTLQQGKKDDAVKYGQAAVRAAPQYAAGHYAFAAALALANRGSDAAAQSQLAGKYDAAGLGGRSIPKVKEAFYYFATGGRTVVLVPPGS